MPVLNTQPLQTIVDVSVTIQGGGVALPTLNQGLIGGSSAVIPTYGTNPRIRQYTSLAGMLTDGFLTTSPEYISAQGYFAQNPAAVYLWVGRQDLTAISTVTVGAVGGTGYVVGDILTVTQGGAQGGQVSVTTIGGSGAVTGAAIVPQNQGTGYAVANNLATTGGTGTGCEIDITAIGESVLQAITTCRVFNSQWWMVTWCGATTADAEAVAPYAAAAQPPMMYAHVTSDAAVLNGTAGNVALVLSAGNYNRVYGQYATTQGGAYPNNLYTAGGAIVGRAMGLNTYLANSYFSLNNYTINSVPYEPLTTQQIANIGVNPLTGITSGPHFNTIVNFANNSYDIEQYGTVANGQYFDQILNQDMIVSDCQYSVMNLLVNNTISNSNSGYVAIQNVLNGVCQRGVTRGWIQSGVWTGSTILGLTYGTSLQSGYLVQFAGSTTLTTAQIAARQACQFYVCIIAPGAIASLSIGLVILL